MSEVQGLTPRDWFAGMALQGLIAGKVIPASITAKAEEQRAAVVRNAYEYADLMVREGQRLKKAPA
jgi:hypothetical protein